MIVKVWEVNLATVKSRKICLGDWCTSHLTPLSQPRSLHKALGQLFPVAVAVAAVAFAVLVAVAFALGVPSLS